MMVQGYYYAGKKHILEVNVITVLVAEHAHHKKEAPERVCKSFYLDISVIKIIKSPNFFHDLSPPHEYLAAYGIVQYNIK